MNEETKKRITDINNGIIPEGYKKTKVGIVPVEWEECHFKKMFSRLKRKNTENNTNVLTISAQYGLINQEEFFNKSVASDDKSNYYLMYRGDFAYNKSYSNGYPFGAIKALEKYDKGVVSPLYICFSPTDENKCSDFYLQYFENGMMNKEIQAIAQEGARNHGLLNIGIDDFFNSYLIVPPLPEQLKIAEILGTQDKLIELQERKINQLKTLKKGYLQKMFPKKGSKFPELRFKGFTDAWEQRKLGDKMYIKSRIGWQALTKDEYLDTGDYYLITGTDIDEITHTVDLSRCYYVSKERYDMDDKIQIHEGDIIITKDGTIGKVAMISGLDKPATLNSHLFVLRDLSGTLNNRFLLQVLNSHIFDSFVESTKTGSTLTGLPQKTFVEFKFYAPRYEEQKKISGYLDNLDHLITLHQRKLDKEKQKKKALMQLLLTGKVRVI